MPKKVMKFAVLLAPALIGFFVVLPQVAEAKSWSIVRWDSDITLEKDGTFGVRETRTFDFQGDVSRVEVEVSKHRVSDIVDFQVLDKSGREIALSDASMSSTDKAITVRLNFTPLVGEKTWIFSYRVIGGIGFFENYDELFWDALPSDHPTEVKAFTATVHLPRPAEFLDRFDQVLYVGTESVTEKSDQITIVDAQTIRFQGVSLPPRVGMMFVASWPKGIIDDPGTLLIKARSRDQDIIGASIRVDGALVGVGTPHAFQITNPASSQQVVMITLEKFGYATASRQLTLTRGRTETFIFELVPAWWFGPLKMIAALIVLLAWLAPFIIFIRLWRRWKKFGQDPQFSKPSVPVPEPPAGLWPSEMGALVDERVDISDITSAIVHLAVLRHLTIREIPAPGLSHQQQNFLLLRTDKDPTALPHYERQIMEALFQNSDQIDMQKDFRDRLYPELPKIRTAVYQSIVAKGYFSESPEFVRRRYLRQPILWLILLLSLGFVGTIISAWSLTVAVPLLMADAIALLFASLMPKKTLKGVETRWLTSNFQRYLCLPDRFRAGDISPETFERYLPYAMVLGVERKWAERFVNVYTQTPAWYQAGFHQHLGAFSVVQLVGELAAFANTTTAAIETKSKRVKVKS